MIAIVFVISLYITIVSGQLLLPSVPNAALPSPQNFLQLLLNDTTGELIDLVSDFSFNEITPKDIFVNLYNSDGVMKIIKIDASFPQVNRNKPLKFLIHGWQETGDNDFIKTLTSSYHSIGIDHVFVIDWSLHSKRSYIHAARGIKKIGEQVGKYVMHVIENDKKFLTNVHLIGHSLGAHVAGFAGKHVTELTNGEKIGRITALDAAGPLFEFPVILPQHLRLTKADAVFVEGFHTNAGFLGFLKPFAHADYYINFGGPIQLGCFQPNVFESFVCSHSKSYSIYNATITSKNYLATPCNSSLDAVLNLCDNNKKVIIGEHGTNNHGEFYINVSENNIPN